MLITDRELPNLPSNVRVNVHSHGYFVYSVEFRTANASRFYSRDGLEVQRFMSLQGVKQAFQTLPLRDIWLVHHSAYDEMVGQPLGAETELTVPLDFSLPYE